MRFLQVTAFHLFRSLLRGLPHAMSGWLGARLGEVAYLYDGRHRRIALSNLERVWPQRSRGERQRLAKASFRRLGAATCQTLSAARFDRSAFADRLHWVGADNLDALAGGGFVLSAHLGHWEVAALALGLRSRPLHIVGRPLDNPALDRQLRDLRQRFGNRLLSRRGGVRAMLRVVQEGGWVGVLLDQHCLTPDAIDVPFLGLPSRTSSVLARLSLRTGAPVVPVYALEEGHGFRVVVEPPILPERDGPGAVLELTRRYLTVIEGWIRGHPEQWLWMHRRWRLGPCGAVSEAGRRSSAAEGGTAGAGGAAQSGTPGPALHG